MIIKGKRDALMEAIYHKRRVEALFIGVVIILFTTLLILTILYT